MLDIEMSIGLTAFPVAVAGIVAATTYATRELIDWIAQRRAEAIEQIVSELESKLLQSLDTLSRKKNYRHNLHCPKCGRFAARVEGMPDQVTNCKHHGIWLRTPEGPVQLHLHTPSELTAQVEEPPPLAIEPPKPIEDELDTGVITLPSEECPTCYGSGEITGYINEIERDTEDCPTCDGSGRVLARS